MAEIHLRDVTVDIPVLGGSNRSFKNTLLSAATGGTVRVENGKKVSIRALESISLSLKDGDRLGLIGHNGAGKSTLLRLMAGIYAPSTGEVSTEGRIAPIFELGFGMDPESNGWDNIILRGIALGLSIDEIKPSMNAIAEFADLGEFMDMPLRTFSSGMTARLAFAISTSVEADIFLIDEGIAAGDAAFMSRARQRTDALVRRAGVLVVASHNDALLEDWCTHGLWLEHGRPRLFGPINETLDAYRLSVAQQAHLPV